MPSEPNNMPKTMKASSMGTPSRLDILLNTTQSKITSDAINRVKVIVMRHASFPTGAIPVLYNHMHVYTYLL